MTMRHEQQTRQAAQRYQARLRQMELNARAATSGSAPRSQPWAGAQRLAIAREDLSQTGLQQLPSSVVLELAQQIWRIEHQAGDLLVVAGEHCYDLLVVQQGELSITRAEGPGEVGVASVGAGETYGEIAFLTRMPARTNLRAATVTTCLLLRADFLDGWCRKYPLFGLRLATLVLKRLACVGVRG